MLRACLLTSCPRPHSKTLISHISIVTCAFVSQVHCSSVPYGSGTVRTAHGLLPVPAPATLKLMLGLPTRPGPPHASGELCTPTGVALLRSLTPDLALSWASGRPPPGFTPTHVGLGAGSKNFPGHPNVVRAVIGHVPTTSGSGANSGAAAPPSLAANSAQPSGSIDHGHKHAHGGAGTDHDTTPSSSTASTSSNAASALGSASSSAKVGVGAASGSALSDGGSSGSAEGGSYDWNTSTLFVVEANLDDMPAENLAYAVQKLLDAGALDAWTSVCILWIGLFFAPMIRTMSRR